MKKIPYSKIYTGDEEECNEGGGNSGYYSGEDSYDCYDDDSVGKWCFGRHGAFPGKNMVEIVNEKGQVGYVELGVYENLYMGKYLKEKKEKEQGGKCEAYVKGEDSIGDVQSVHSYGNIRIQLFIEKYLVAYDINSDTSHSRLIDSHDATFDTCTECALFAEECLRREVTTRGLHQLREVDDSCEQIRDVCNDEREVEGKAESEVVILRDVEEEVTCDESEASEKEDDDAYKTVSTTNENENEEQQRKSMVTLINGEINCTFHDHYGNEIPMSEFCALLTAVPEVSWLDEGVQVPINPDSPKPLTTEEIRHVDNIFTWYWDSGIMFDYRNWDGEVREAFSPMLRTNLWNGAFPNYTINLGSQNKYSLGSPSVQYFQSEWKQAWMQHARGLLWKYQDYFQNQVILPATVTYQNYMERLSGIYDEQGLRKLAYWIYLVAHYDMHLREDSG